MIVCIIINQYYPIVSDLILGGIIVVMLGIYKYNSYHKVCKTEGNKLICEIGGKGEYNTKLGGYGSISEQERINIKTELSNIFKQNNSYDRKEFENIYYNIMKRLNTELDCKIQQDSSEFVQVIIDKVFDKGNIMENANYFSDLSTEQSPIDINTDYTWDDKCKLNENKIIDKELVDQIFIALYGSIRSKRITQSDIYGKNIKKISKIIIDYNNIQEKANDSLNKIKNEQKLKCDNITDIFITVIIRKIIDNYGFFSPLFNESFYIMNVQSTIYMNTQPDNNYKKLLEEIVLRKQYITEFDDYQLVAFNELRGTSKPGGFTNSNRIINAGHYITYVLRNINGNLTVYECNDRSINKLSTYTSLEELMESKIDTKDIRTTMLLFANKNNIKTDMPTGLNNFTGSACFVNSGIQILLSTNLFDDNNSKTTPYIKEAKDTIKAEDYENAERAKTEAKTEEKKEYIQKLNIIIKDVNAINRRSEEGQKIFDNFFNRIQLFIININDIDLEKIKTEYNDIINESNLLNEKIQEAEDDASTEIITEDRKEAKKSEDVGKEAGEQIDAQEEEIEDEEIEDDESKDDKDIDDEIDNEDGLDVYSLYTSTNFTKKKVYNKPYGLGSSPFDDFYKKIVSSEV